MEVVQSVDRALSILELLSNHSEGLRIVEISEKIDLHKSTVHRLLGTLMHKGFVEQDEVTNRYRISIKLYELGSKRIEDMDILRVSKKYTKKLMMELNEVVHLVIRDGNEIVYIDKVEADNTIRMASTIGRRSPLYCTSVGKSILAFADEEEVKHVWKNSNIVKWTENTITNYEKFEKELEKVRQQGYAEDNEENELGIRCIGAPVFNNKGEVEGAISISVPILRVTEDKLQESYEAVKKYADIISKELGYRG